MAKALADSGDTVAAFARLHSLDAQRVHWWQQRLDKLDAREPILRFAPVRLVAADSRVELPQEPQRAPSSIEVALAGGRVVRVGRGFDADTLRRVVEALEEDGAC